MPIFKYKGLDSAGKHVKASVTADSIIAAKQKIKSLNIMLVDINEQTSGVSIKRSSMSFRSKVPVGDLAVMTRQLATLTRAKIPIVESLSALTDQVENANLKLILSELKQKVNEGTSLANALGDYPKVFDTVYINMVEAGEASGTLEIVLLRLAEFTESQVKLRNRIKGAMTYPVVMAVFGLVMMNVIFIFVIPKIAKIFESMKKELPIQTKICIGISNFLQNYWWLVIIITFVSWFLLKKYFATEKGIWRWHAIQLKMPIFGILIKMINVSRFSSTLATLLNSGVPILTSLTIVKNLIPNVHMRATIDKSREAVKEGSSLAGPLIQSGHFPALVTHMIKLGERSGELEDMLKIVSENYEEQVDARINGLTATLEPLMMILLGIAVGFIVMSVIVPMMSLSQI